MTSISLGKRFIIEHALLASKLSKRMAHSLGPHGISFSEYLLMHYLHSAPLAAVPRMELAEQLSMSASGITRLIAPMEKIGILSKESNARDARQSLVKLTEAGKRLFEEANVSAEHAAEFLTKGLSDAQLEKSLQLYAQLK